MISFKKLVAMPLMAAVLVAGCSSAAATPIPATPAAVSNAPASVAPVAGSATVVTKDAGAAGTVVVAGSNMMTVYTYTKDTAGSASTCTAACLVKWPALTVPAGTTPTAGTGVTGKLATITRTDDGTLQVTYNGLPLYFYQGDKAPGDTTGSYPNWVLVKP